MNFLNGEKTMNEKTKGAFIAIVGKPNVGKSSVMNRILGQKVAIVSDKPQTTRNRIMGVLTEGETQLVFIDTPGLHKPRNVLGQTMVKAIEDSVSDVDAAMLVVDASEFKGEPSKADVSLIERFNKQRIPAILVINKIDLLNDKEKLLKITAVYNELFPFGAIIYASARDGYGCDVIVNELKSYAQEGPHFFDEDMLTDQTERSLAAEIIREKLLRSLDKEVPHGIAVVIEKFKDRKTNSGEDIVDIDAVIYCESDSHKGIVIGKGGAMLKKVSSYARRDMETFFECKVNLSCWVKVKEDWRNRQALIHNFELD